MSLPADLARHSGHLVAFGLPSLAGLTAITAVEMNERRARSTGGHDRSPLPGAAWVAAGASVGAGVIHGAVCSEHFREAMAYGVFFLLFASTQLCWSVLALLRPGPTLWRTGLALNASIVALWAVSRTSGLPIGPHHWTAEAVSQLDLAAALFELTAVFSCARLLRVRPSVGDMTGSAASASPMKARVNV